MNRRKGFTLVELLVVIAIIALLMAILMPALARVRKQALAAACMVHMKQWATIYSMYTGDFDGYFCGDYEAENKDDDGNGVKGSRKDWWNVLESYYEDRALLACPAAKKTEDEGAAGPYRAKLMDNAYKISVSYNGWVGQAENPDRADDLKRYVAWRWATVNRTKKPNLVPVMGDTIGHARKFVHATTDPADSAWSEPDVNVGSDHPNRLIEFRLRRHGPENNPNINMAFADFSVRPVRLKALWSLDWHRNWRRNRAAESWGKDMVGQIDIWPEFMKAYSEEGVMDY
ncbi:MAG: type II secretion system protein [Planctomycetes bacterium]|nr:type II secretion system protein [Planctomycetota bacterium]